VENEDEDEDHWEEEDLDDLEDANEGMSGLGLRWKR
jgi:hypothetical protein